MHERGELPRDLTLGQPEKHVEEALHHEEREHREQRDDQKPLQPGGFFCAADVERRKSDGEGHGQAFDDPQLLRLVAGQERGDARRDGEVSPHAQQREGRLEHQRQPGAQPPDRAGPGAEAAVEEVVGAAGPRQGRGQLGHAEHGRDHEDACDQVGQHGAGAGVGGRQARQQEEPGAEHRPGADGVDVPEAEFFLELLTRLGFGRVGHR